MTFGFHFSEFGYQLLVFIDYECTALDTKLNITVHVFFFDDVKKFTHDFLVIA